MLINAQRVGLLPALTLSRYTLTRMLTEASGLEVAAAVTSAEEALEVLKS